MQSPVGTPALVLSTGPYAQNATAYKGGIDANAAVSARGSFAFAAHPASTPNMTVVVGPGSVFNTIAPTLVEMGSNVQATLNSTTAVTLNNANGVANGQQVTGPGIPAGTTVASGGGTVNIVLSAAATITASNVPLVFEQISPTITAPVGNPRIDRIVINQTTGAVSVITGTPSATPTPPALTSNVFPVAQVLLQSTSTVITNSMITDERNTWTTPGLKNGAFTVVGTAAAENLSSVIVDNGSGALTIGTNQVTNAMMSQAATLTLLSNITGGTANRSDNTLTAILDAALGSTQGSVLYRGASAWATLGPGTAGQALTTGGAGANPSWANASGIQQLASQTASGVATLTFSGIATTAKRIIVNFNSVGSTVTTYIYCQLFVSGVASGSYTGNNGGLATTSASTIAGIADTSFVHLCPSVGSQAISGRLVFERMDNTANWTYSYNVRFVNGTFVGGGVITGMSGAPTGFQIGTGSGNVFTSGGTVNANYE